MSQSNLGNVEASVSLKAFKSIVGNHWDKLVNDVNSALGREFKNVNVKNGAWKVGTKGKLVAKDGKEWNLPLNNPMFSLVRFGIKLNEISLAGSDAETNFTMEVDATIPAACNQWFTSSYINANVETADKAYAAKHE